MSEIYVVKSGDTLSKISAQYNVDGGYQALARYNNIANPAQINVGQKIVIPSPSSQTGGATSAENAQLTSSGTVKITAQALNVRTGAGTNFKVLGTLSEGQTVAYSGEQNGWLKISYHGQDAWISKKFAQAVTDGSAQTDSAQQTENEKVMYVTASSLNVRSGEGTSNAVLGTVSRGQAVSVLSESNGWARIKYGSGNSYVSAKYLSETKPTSSSAQMPEFQAGENGAYSLEPEKLAKVSKRATKYYSHIVSSMGVASITTRQRTCCYIAQLAHESDGFNTLEEYASGAAYEGRTDLGNTQKGDGKRFKGRGAIQLTGRSNYAKASQDLGIDLVSNPSIVSENPELAFKVSAWYWNTNNLNSYCDAGDFKGLTRAINGGLNGYADRLNYYNLGKQYL